MSYRSFVPAVVLALILAGNASTAIAAQEETPFSPLALTPAAAECTASSPLGALTVPEPIFLSCSAHATCWGNSSVTCVSGSGSCIGIDASCPGQAGYVQCGGTTSYCPPCPILEFGCNDFICTSDAQCDAFCPDPQAGNRCRKGCPPDPGVKTCYCFA